MGMTCFSLISKSREILYCILIDTENNRENFRERE